ncbi:MAG: PilN domain-containing protein [Cyanobacteriota bacterium]|nr:PilN domain-containing protein [Cyanobacteriota bacterium]
MYSIDINFLKDRAAPAPSGGAGAIKVKKKALSASDLLPLFVGAGVGILFLALTGGAYAYVLWRTGETQEVIDAKNSELQQLQVQQQEIDRLRADIEIARTQVSGLAGVFGRIKSWSAILQDIRDRVPGNVRISSIQQIETQQVAPVEEVPPAEGEAAAAVAPPPISLSISGFAASYQTVNDFLLSLKGSQLFSPGDTRLVAAELVAYPGSVQQQGESQVEIELPEVVQYEIQTQLTPLPDPELLRVLERKGALGLATRLRAAEAIGGASPEPVVAPQEQEVEPTGEVQQ